MRPAILLTGYSEMLDDDQIHALLETTVMFKPYISDHLLMEIQRILTGRS